MAITAVKDLGKIALGGGNFGLLQRVNEDGSPLTGGTDDWHILPHVVESTLPSDVDEKKEITFEDNTQVNARGLRRVGAKFTFGQSDDKTQALKEETRGKFYRLYYKDAPLMDGKIREYFFGVGTIMMNIEKSNKAGELQQLTMEYTCNKNENEIVLLQDDSGGSTGYNLPNVYDPDPLVYTADDVTIAAGAYYARTETTPA